MSSHKIKTEPLSGNQGQAFQAHPLQIILFEPITHEPNIVLGSLKIVSLQLAPSVGKACALAQVAVESSLYQAEAHEVSSISSDMQLLLRHKLSLGATPCSANSTGSSRGFQPQANSPHPGQGANFRKITSFGQNQGLAWSSDSSLWGNQLLKRKTTSFGQNQGLAWSSDSSL